MAWLNRMMPADDVRRPRCEVTAYPGTAGPDVNQLSAGGCPLTGILLSLRTTKTLQSPAGQFELRVTYDLLPGYGRSLSRVLVPGNFVDIAFDAGLPDSKLETTMRGWVTDIEESETLDSRGKPIRSISVSGQDCGMFYLRHDMPTYMWTQFAWGAAEVMGRMRAGIEISGAPGHVLRSIYHAVFQVVTPIRAVAEEGGLLTDPILDNVGDQADPDYWLSELAVNSIWDQNGRFWNTFSQYTDRPWNEAYGDFIPDPATSQYSTFKQADGTDSPVDLKLHLDFDNKPLDYTRFTGQGAGYYLIVRRSPFSKDRWDRLPTTVLYEREIKLARIRATDDERVNLVIVEPFGHGWDATNELPFVAVDMRAVLHDPDSIRRHGLRTMRQRSIYFDQANSPLDPKVQEQYGGQTGALYEAVAKRTSSLWRWTSVNHRLKTGVLIVAGIPSIRIGERVRVFNVGRSASFVSDEQIPYVFYVEKVVQDYTEGSGYLTHLAVTRGQEPDHFVEARSEGIEMSATTGYAGG